MTEKGEEKVGEPSPVESTQKPVQQPPGMGGSQMLLLMLFPFLLLIMMDGNLRDGMGASMSGILAPSIGMDGRYPALTIGAAGLLMVLLSSLVNHYFADYFVAGRNKKLQEFVSKEMNRARAGGDLERLKEVSAIQPELMKMNMETMSAQMKGMVVTMVVAIAVFMWLPLFLSSLAQPAITTPWDPNWNLNGKGPLFGLFPRWIILYMLLSYPFGKALQTVLKVLTFKGYLPLLKRKRKEADA